jgi:hypothetical protein
MKLNGLSYKCFAPQSELEPIQVRDKKSLKIPTKVVIRIRKSKKNRQHNDQKKKYKRTNNDLQHIHIELNIE